MLNKIFNQVVLKYDNIIKIQEKPLNQNNKIYNRNYGIDLLRILSMINVINLHINLFSHQLLIKYNNPNYKYIWFLEVLSYSAVNCFGLISGMVGFKKFHFSNVIYLWNQSFFYSISKSIYFYFIGKLNINQINLIQFLLNILMKKNWYFNAYISIFFLIPFVNIGIISLNRKFHRNIIIFLILFYSITDIFTKIYNLKIDNFLNNGYSSMWLLILYIIGSFFGKYLNVNDFNLLNLAFYIIIYFLSTLLSLEIHFKLIKSRSKITNRLLISNISPTMIIQAISLVKIFSKLKIENKLLIKIISFLSKLTFGALFIHETLFQSRISIITNLFDWIFKYNNQFVFFKIYFFSVIIYIFSVIIDYFRLLIFKFFNIRELCIFFEKEIPKLIDNIIFKLDNFNSL